MPPSKKLEDLIHLTELCVDLLQQNEEHYAEVRDKREIIASLTIICHTQRKSFCHVINGLQNRSSYGLFSLFFCQDENVQTQLVVIFLSNRLKTIPLTQ